MRKFVGFLLLLAVLWLLGSLFFPTGLQLRESVNIFNNEKVVVQQLQQLKNFGEWLEKVQGRTVRENTGAIYWSENNRNWKAYFQSGGKEGTLLLRIQNVDTKENYNAVISFQEIAEKNTRVSVAITSEQHTLNPLRRYGYYWSKKSAILKLKEALQFVKQKCEAIHFERFHLTNPKIVAKNDLAFCLYRNVRITDLQRNKEEKIDSLLLQRLARYKLLDTLKNVFFQYSDWNDTMVNYSICIPLLKSPTPRQQLWLQSGECQTIKGRYYTATYTGKPQDLPLAWDSLYTILKNKDLKPQGFPLEELLEKTDATELRKLFVRIR